MIHKSAISKYMEVQKMVGSNYPDKKIEDIIKQGIKFNIEIYKNDNLIQELFTNHNDIFVECEKEIELLEDLLGCEKEAEVSR